MPLCGTCHREIRVCDECGGLLCTPACVDRLEDGCVCDEDDGGVVVDDTEDGEDTEEIKEEDEA